MTKREHSGDMATLVREEVAAAGLAMGLAERVCSDLAAQVEDRVRLRASGDSGYVCKVDRTKRNAEIRARWNGANERELARDFKLSPRRVQQIVREK